MPNGIGGRFLNRPYKIGCPWAAFTTFYQSKQKLYHFLLFFLAFFTALRYDKGVKIKNWG
jgi:hypothetical protein